MNKILNLAQNLCECNVNAVAVQALKRLIKTTLQTRVYVLNICQNLILIEMSDQNSDQISDQNNVQNNEVLKGRKIRRPKKVKEKKITKSEIEEQKIKQLLTSYSTYDWKQFESFETIPLSDKTRDGLIQN